MAFHVYSPRFCSLSLRREATSSFPSHLENTAIVADCVVPCLGVLRGKRCCRTHFSSTFLWDGHFCSGSAFSPFFHQQLQLRERTHDCSTHLWTLQLYLHFWWSPFCIAVLRKIEAMMERMRHNFFRGKITIACFSSFWIPFGKLRKAVTNPVSVQTADLTHKRVSVS